MLAPLEANRGPRPVETNFDRCWDAVTLEADTNKQSHPFFVLVGNRPVRPLGKNPSGRSRTGIYSRGARRSRPPPLGATQGLAGSPAASHPSSGPGFVEPACEMRADGASRQLSEAALVADAMDHASLTCTAGMRMHVELMKHA